MKLQEAVRDKYLRRPIDFVDLPMTPVRLELPPVSVFFHSSFLQVKSLRDDPGYLVRLYALLDRVVGELVLESLLDLRLKAQQFVRFQRTN